MLPQATARTAAGPQGQHITPAGYCPEILILRMITGVSYAPLLVKQGLKKIWNQLSGQLCTSGQRARGTLEGHRSCLKYLI